MKPFVFFAALGIAFAPALDAGEMTMSASADQPQGAFVIQSMGDTDSNNICKWHPEHAPGSRRDVGQRIVTGRTQQTVNRFVLKIAGIRAGVGSAAPESEFVFRIVRFDANDQIKPLPDPVLDVKGRFPAEAASGDYLVIDFPDVELEPSSVYGLEVGFAEPGAGRSVNFDTTASTSYKGGRIYFLTNEPDANSMAYVLRSANFVFLLGSQ